MDEPTNEEEEGNWGRMERTWKWAKSAMWPSPFRAVAPRKVGNPLCDCDVVVQCSVEFRSAMFLPASTRAVTAKLSNILDIYMEIP